MGGFGGCGVCFVTADVRVVMSWVDFGRDVELEVVDVVLDGSTVSFEEDATGRLDESALVDESSRVVPDIAVSFDEVLLVVIDLGGLIAEPFADAEGPTGRRAVHVGAAVIFELPATISGASFDVSRPSVVVVLAGVRDVDAVLEELAAVVRMTELVVFASFPSSVTLAAGALVTFVLACGSGSDTFNTLFICLANFSSSDSGSTATDFAVAVVLVLLVGLFAGASCELAVALVFVRGGIVTVQYPCSSNDNVMTISVV